MRRLSRSAVVRAALAGSALVLILAAVAVMVVPRLVPLERLRESLVTQLAAQLGAHVELASLHVSLLPVPHVVLDQLHVSVTPTVDVTIVSAAVYPGLWALLTGTLQLSQVVVSGVRVTLQVPQQALRPTTHHDAALHELRESVVAALAQVSSVAAAHAPGLVLRVTEGVASVATADGQVFAFTDVRGSIHLPPTQLRFDLTGHSTLWEQAALQAAIDPASMHGDGHLTVSGLRPEVVGHDWIPADLQIGNAPANVDATFNAEGLDALHASVVVTVPTLPLQRGVEHLTLVGANLKASLHADAQTAAVTLDAVRLASPPVQLSGSLVLNRATSQLRLELDGKDLDVSATHEAAVFFAASNPTIRSIFDVLRAGKVPRLTLQAQGGKLGDLGSLDAMVIRGDLVGGAVHVPGADLDLADVSGAVSIADGVLTGEHAAGRLGNTRASDGSVRVGLSDQSRELSVTTAIQADVSDIPAVLQHVVANQTLDRILGRLTDVQGTATGRLTLSGPTDAVTAALDVSQLSVSVRDRDMRQPLQMEGGEFHYDPRSVTATDVKVTTGDSTMAALSLRVDLSATPSSLEVTGTNGQIALAQVYPWAAAMGWLPDSTWTPTAVTGTAGIDSVRVRGPAALPSAWRVELAGAVPNLDLEAPRLREAVAVRFPLSLTDLRLTHEPAATALSVRGATLDGLSGTIDVVWNGAELNIKRASIRDAESNASASLLLKERQFDFTFSGNLEAATLQALVPSDRHRSQSLRGKLAAHIVMDRPTDATAEGQLEADHVILPPFGNLKIEVERAILKGNAGLFTIDADANLGPSAPHLHLSGAVQPAPEAFIADLDLLAGPVDWAWLEPLLPPAVPDGQVAETEAETEAETPAKPLPLRGKLRLRTEAFTYGGYTWRPVRAVVDLTPGTQSITVTQTTLCGIETPGRISATPEGLSLGFTPVAKNQPVDQLGLCLFGKAVNMTGQCSLTAQVDASGPSAEIAASAHGKVHFTATNGRLYGGGMIEKVLALLSVGYGSWNLLSDLTDDGMPYNTIDVKGDVRDGQLVLTEATMDAPSMKMVAQGHVDLRKETIDLMLLAAPLKTVDTVVSHIPVLGYVLGGSLVTIPVKVKGSLSDPKVTPMSPSEVGGGLLRVMTRVVKLPLRALQLVTPQR